MTTVNFSKNDLVATLLGFEQVGLVIFYPERVGAGAKKSPPDGQKGYLYEVDMVKLCI
jgi:hypothetical protein